MGSIDATAITRSTISIPLGLGGADVRENLWPESRYAWPWNAAAKDRLEDYLDYEVCAGHVPIEVARREIKQDWVDAYWRYLGVP